MVVVDRKQAYQERLAKEDLTLLIEALLTCLDGQVLSSNTRIEMLIERLKRMKKQ